MILNLLLRPNLPLPRRYHGVKKDLAGKFVRGERVTFWSVTITTFNVKALQEEMFLGKVSDRTMLTITARSLTLKRSSLLKPSLTLNMNTPKNFSLSFYHYCLCLGLRIILRLLMKLRQS